LELEKFHIAARSRKGQLRGGTFTSRCFHLKTFMLAMFVRSSPAPSENVKKV
jgi:hypothetical protein